MYYVPSSVFLGAGAWVVNKSEKVLVLVDLTFCEYNRELIWSSSTQGEVMSLKLKKKKLYQLSLIEYLWY